MFWSSESSNNNKKIEDEIKVESEVKEEKRSEPVDWKPQDKCYFCVDGKLLKVSESGELVVETGPVQPEAELNKHVRRRGNESVEWY
jgi:PP-loop superfamily ATP-utilizing enzyme